MHTCMHTDIQTCTHTSYGTNNFFHKQIHHGVRAESASARDGHGHVDVYGDGGRDGGLDTDVDVYVDEDVDGDVATHVAHPMQLIPL